ncbi:TerD family protein [Pseudoalteromonas sp. TB64]|uniref:TerD family protein n=1 Tax=Pseudoalteromonas sp. TB64 TaxID=1938600 RepID=UPI00041FAF07|nr:TerD family protein [Pseudoalteromonas sp. TB64]
MQLITNGQNLVVNATSIQVNVECELSGNNANEIDVSAFLLNKDNKTRNDDDFIFYNQPSSLDRAVTLSSGNAQKQSFTINLAAIDADIHKIVFVITTPSAFKLASFLKVSVDNLLEFSPTLTDMNETSLNLAEVYRHKGQWKFRAIGQGYAGGLAPIAIDYGVDIEDKPNETKPAAAITPTPVISKPMSNTVNKPVNIKKVDLSKAGEKATISLEKGNKLTAKLQWDTQADLDLYCFYVDKNDVEEKVYYKKLGSLTAPPFIKLLGDSQVAGEEIVEISQPDNIKYALICAYSAVSNGIGSFHSYKARVEVTDGKKQSVTSHLNHNDPKSYWVAFALIDFQQAGQVTIKNVETYSSPSEFKAQMKQRTGKEPKFFSRSNPTVNGVSKYDPERSPHLFKDGSFMMSAGIVEFK